MAEKVGFEQSRESFALANPGMFVPFLLLQKQHLDVHSLHASVPEFVRQLLYSEIIFYSNLRLSKCNSQSCFTQVDIYDSDPDIVCLLCQSQWPWAIGVVVYVLDECQNPLFI